MDLRLLDEISSLYEETRNPFLFMYWTTSSLTGEGGQGDEVNTQNLY
jgi:hypothetical protein